MAFSRATRDEYHLCGSDAGITADYIKGPPARVFKDLARRDREERTSSLAPKKPPLPKVGLKTEKRHARVDRMTKLQLKNDAGGAAAVISGYGVKADPQHPLSRFERPKELRDSGCSKTMDGSYEKITAAPYDAGRSHLERGVAFKAAGLNLLANKGSGYSMFGAFDEPPQVLKV
eukprot:gnl/MRDRNA2_/MRDRNA2_109032_c0_seq1.p1 gnl/MRDRNA2_/MRDRNA2_109032_c0~~gnl/MRDRNA2_/MRDRNA2_109032_c0_seq1.p1  ORF type:complete len:175 (+),score=33.47 gnl/MRDRNA2_/MRDRNA2_109032_c0_seq1:94-618(+)